MDRVTEIRTTTVVYLGPGAVDTLEQILSGYRAKGTQRIGILTGRSSYRSSGAWQKVVPVIDALGFEYLHFERIEPNPTTALIDRAVEFFRPYCPQLLIAIGGGSVIDTTKVVAACILAPEVSAEDLYLKRWTPEQALPVVAVNLTHGTGSEVDRYAVATVQRLSYKAGTAHRCLYPAYAIDDPELMVSLSPEQTRYTTLDAMNHLIEAATTKKASAYTVMLAREGISKIAQWLPVVLREPDDIEARGWLLYASMLGGAAIDSAVVHLTHPMEHLLSAINPALPHGLGLTLLLPAVLEVIYQACKDVLREILLPVIGKDVPDSAEYIRDSLRQWLISVGFTEDLGSYGFTEESVPDLVARAKRLYDRTSSLYLAPVEPTEQTLEYIYRSSINYPLKK